MHRTIFIILLLAGLMAVPMGAQTNLADIQAAFQSFSQEFASSLPYLSSVGLNWNDAYIGNFPHFGVGLSAGFAAIPYGSIQPAAQTLGVDLSTLGPVFQTIGFPLPTWCLDARVGGFGIPFDVGFKIGFLPEEAKVFLPENVNFTYLLIGGDFRWGILEDNGAAPAISVGLGANYLSGGITISNVTPAQQIDTSNTTYFPSFGGQMTDIDPGNFDFGWQAFSMELKAQISKKLLIFSLSAGVAGSYSLYATAYAGVKAPVTVGGIPITQAQINEIKSIYPDFDLSQTQFLATGTANGWALRAFGGLSFNILVVRIDISAMYNFLSGALGATVNIRAQF